MRIDGRRARDLLRRGVLVLLSLLSFSCHVIFDGPTAPGSAPDAAGVRSQISAGDRLVHLLDNLGEVEPGVLYRSGAMSPALLEFLEAEHDLRHILALNGRAEPPEEALVERQKGVLEILRMSADRAPSVDEILAMIRITHAARSGGGSILMHCRAGADRTGMMVAIWRMLFQHARDRDALLAETRLHYHLPLAHPVVHRVIETFDPEVFRPFVERPELLDDEDAVANARMRYHLGFPLVSGRTRVTTGALRAGVGKASLLREGELDVPMASYGPLPGRSRGVRQPVYARALVLENAETRLAIISLDVLICDRRVRDEVLRRLEMSGIDDVLLAATHTHTSVGGYVDNALFEFYMLGDFAEEHVERLVDASVTAAQAAIADLRPARLGAASTRAPGLAANRRIGTTVDDELGLLRITQADGAPLAVVVNFAAHPILEPDDQLVSSDYPGLLCATLDRELGFGLFLGGALGDLNARPHGSPDVFARAGLAEQVAGSLAQLVLSAVPSIETRSEVSLASMTEWIDLPPRNLPSIPDLFWPIEAPILWLSGWRERYAVQGLRIGDLAMFATASELGCRVGLQIKRLSPAPIAFVVSHANDYAGYALTGSLHAKSKIDASSFVAMNGPQHARRLVDAAAGLFETLFETDVDRGLNQPSTADRRDIAALRETLDGVALEDAIESIDRTEREAILADADETLSQSRAALSAFGDSFPETFRLRLGGAYRDDLRAARGIEGEVRDLDLGLAWRGPLDLRIDLATGYRRATWSSRTSGREESEGARDLTLGVDRALDLFTEPDSGLALRAVPRLALTVPTGDTDDSAPFAIAPSAGVLRPGVGGAFELVWSTYHTLRAEMLYTTRIGRYRGRAPGDRIDAALRYLERHGATTLGLSLLSETRLEDRRAGGAQAVDLDHLSWWLALAPLVAVHLGEHVELHVEGRFGIAGAGPGGEAGQGLHCGLVFGW